MSTAIVHEWLESKAGSEQTFLQMAEVFPDADLYALTAESGVVPRVRVVGTTFLQRSAFLRRHRELTLPLMPLAWRMLRARQYDLVITSTHAFARYFRTADALHLSYVYSPMRYAWTPEIDSRGARTMYAPARAICRRLDLRTTCRVHRFAGISTAVVRRINEFYRRDADVIHPPVDVSRFRSASEISRTGGYLLGVSRFVPYKRLDLVIAVGERLQLPVVLAGRGPQRDTLRRAAAAARVPVTIVESPSDGELARLFAECEVLIFPAEEDFGIVPLEAQACGTRVVALAAGGSLDTVRHYETGVLASSQSVDAFERAARDCLALGDRSELCRANADRFSTQAFRIKFSSWVREASSAN